MGQLEVKEGRGEIMLRLMLYLAGFLVLCGICYADDKKERETDVVRKNDAIIRKVHVSGGLIFAVPPYWGRESTRAGFEKLAKHLGNATHNEVVLIILKDYESLLKRTMAGQYTYSQILSTPSA